MLSPSLYQLITRMKHVVAQVQSLSSWTQQAEGSARSHRTMYKRNLAIQFLIVCVVNARVLRLKAGSSKHYLDNF